MAKAEKAGVVVVQLRTIVDQFDGFSVWTDDEVPAIVIDRGQEGVGDRVRHTVAHELGHLMLHRGVPRDLDSAEDEADAFASAFLLPRRGILSDFRRTALSPVGLAHLKQKWRVSIAALCMRAAHLGLLDEHAKRRFFMEMSARGWRKREPVQVPVERPQLLRKAIERLRSERRHLRACNVVRFPEIAALIGMESVGG
jgi:Zn-dependent peptidase ImmA (M78 family)